MTPEQIEKWRIAWKGHYENSPIAEMRQAWVELNALCDLALQAHTARRDTLLEIAKFGIEWSEGSNCDADFMRFADDLCALAAQPNNAAGQDSTPLKGSPGEIPAAPSSPPQTEQECGYPIGYGPTVPKAEPAAGGDTLLQKLKKEIKL